MSIKSGAFLKVDRLPQLVKGLRTLATKRTYAGVPADKAPRKDGEPINNAGLMYIHENGAPEANIPARPVVHPAIASIKDEIAAETFKGGQAVLSGKSSAADTMYNRIGILAQNAMRKRITDGPFVPLAPATIAARIAAGRKGQQDPTIYGKGAISSTDHAAATGFRPLIFSGQLRRALTYVVRNIIFGA